MPRNLALALTLLLALGTTRSAGAAAAVAKGPKPEPGSTLAWEQRGRQALRRGAKSEAAVQLRRAIELDPCNWRALHLLGTIHLDAGRPRVALRLLAEASTIARDHEPLAPALWFALGLTHATLDHNFLAARAYRKSLEIDPDQREALNNLAVLYIQSGQYNDAQELLERGLERLPEDAGLEYLLGASCYLEEESNASPQQESHRALLHLKRAYALGYRGRGLWPALGWSALASRDMTLAEQAFRRMLGDGDHRADAQKGLGFVHLRQRKFDAARRYFERSLELAPDDARSHFGLASLRLERGETDAGLAQLERALALDPRYAEALYKKGTTLMQLGRKDEGRAVLERFADLDREREEGIARSRRTGERLAQALALQAEERADDALALLAQAVADDPDSKVAWYHYGQILLQEKGPREALSALQRAVALDPRLAPAHRLLALAWTRLGDPAAARKAELAATRGRFAKLDAR